jgi:DNA-directed RNA polymerase subunit omega
MIIKIPKEFDSKFRFVLVAAERAKQIQNGAPPKVDVKSTKPAHIAVKEVQENRVPYEILLEEKQREVEDEEEDEEEEGE